MTNSNSHNPTPIWRFWVPLVFQTVLILAVPAQAIYTQLIGKTVILQTVPVDPYELFRGYSQTLKYDISLQDNLRKLPGWQELPRQQLEKNKLTYIQPDTRFYVILKAPVSSGSTELPQAWKPVAVSLGRPSKLSVDQVALQGIARNTSVEYGLETYYIPEDQREQINADLREATPTFPLRAVPSQSQQIQKSANSTQPQQKPPVVIEIKVDANGNAVPISLWARVGKASKQTVRNYRF